MLKLNKKTMRIMAYICFAASIAILAFTCYDLAFYRSDKVVTINENQDISYLVHVKPNPYIEAPFLGMDENYLHSYTDYITIDNKYTASSEPKSKIEYTYKVSTVLVSRYRKNAGAGTNPEIMEKAYILEDAFFTANKGNIEITKSFDIVPAQYQSELDAFAATVDIPVSSEIRIDFIVFARNGRGIESTYTRSVTIPVGVEFYNITIDGEKMRSTEHNLPNNILSPFWVSILVIVSVGLFIAGLMIIKRIRNNKSPYRQTIDGYLKNYDELIINTRTLLDFENYKMINIESFKEILNLAKRTNSPIMYYEDVDSAMFYVLRGRIVHLFEVRN